VSINHRGSSSCVGVWAAAALSHGEPECTHPPTSTSVLASMSLHVSPQAVCWRCFAAASIVLPLAPELLRMLTVHAKVRPTVRSRDVRGVCA
jgi:hypothetical protein